MMIKIKEIYFKYKHILLPAVVGVICVAILAMVVGPQVGEYFQGIEKIKTLKNQIETLNNKTEQLQAIDEEAIKKDLVIALSVLPTERDVPRSMSVLQNIIAKSNLILKNTMYSPQSKSKASNSFMLTISVSGTLSSMRGFLDELQNGSGIFKVESITMNTDYANSFVEASIPVTILYEPAPKTLVTLDQPVAVINDKDLELISMLSKTLPPTETISTSSSSSTLVPLGKADLFE